MNLAYNPSSTEKNKDLRYEKNFWDFYNGNRADLDVILNSVCWRYSHSIEPAEMYSELILNLFNSRFLDRWDPSKSRLNTYITSLARGYARRIAGAQADAPFWNNDGYRRENWVRIPADIDTLEAPEETDLEERLQGLRKDYREICEDILAGMKHREICLDRGISASALRNIKKNIQKALVRRERNSHARF